MEGTKPRAEVMWFGTDGRELIAFLRTSPAPGGAPLTVVGALASVENPTGNMRDAVLREGARVYGKFLHDIGTGLLENGLIVPLADTRAACGRSCVAPDTPRVRVYGVLSKLRFRDFKLYVAGSMPTYLAVPASQFDAIEELPAEGIACDIPTGTLVAPAHVIESLRQARELYAGGQWTRPEIALTATA